MFRKGYDRMNKLQYELLGAMIGVVRAAEKNGKTEATDALLLECLRAWNQEDAELSEMVSRIRGEKAKIAPACAYCAMPCGSTADADMETMWQTETEQKEEIFRILFEAAQKLHAETEDRLLYLFHMGLFFLGEDQEEAVFKQVVADLQPLKAL